jgi:hypothetical protein
MKSNYTFRNPASGLSLFILLFFSLLGVQTLRAQVVAWELSAAPGNQVSSNATTLATGITSGVLQRGAGLTAAAAGGCMSASGWFTSSSPTTITDAINGNKYYEFNMVVQSGYYVNLTQVQAYLRSSATGPNTATLRSSLDGFATNIGTVTIPSNTASSTFFTIPFTANVVTGTLTFRLYGYGTASGGGTPATGGTMRIGTSPVATDNDLIIGGTAVQCPAYSGTINVINGVICGTGTGSFSVNMSGGTSPYTVIYTNGSTNTTLTSYVSGTAIQVPAGTYTLVSVSDANTCTASPLTGTANIQFSSGPAVTLTPTNPTCMGNDGTINTTVTAGINP